MSDPKTLEGIEPSSKTEAASLKETEISVRNLNLFYGEKQALKNINMDIPKHAVTAFIGPSGCGKSTFLRTLNRMNDLISGGEDHRDRDTGRRKCLRTGC